MDGQQNQEQQPEEPKWQFKPGETVSPRTQVPPAPPLIPPTQQSTPQAATTQPTVSIQASSPVAAQLPVSVATPEPATAQAVPPPAASALPPAEAVADPGASPLPANSPQDMYPDQSVSWTASEFVAHHKTPGWHLLFVATAIVIAIIVWMLTRDIVSAIVVVLAGGVLSFYGAHKPQQLQYQLSHRGLIIGQKQFAFEDFKSFSIAPDGAFASITLMPSKRFAPLTSIYYGPSDEDAIVGILGDHLPQQEYRADTLDSFMKRIRF